MSQSSLIIPGSPNQQFLAGGLVLLFGIISVAVAVVSGLNHHWVSLVLAVIAALVLLVYGFAILVIAAFSQAFSNPDEEAEMLYDSSFPTSDHGTS